MNKKVIIIAAGVGLASFLGAFATGWFTRPSAASAASEPNQAVATQADTPNQPQQTPPPVLSPTPALPTDEATAARSLSEEQLKELILQVRERIQEYDRKLMELEKEKERLQIAQQTLKKDIETLNNLRVDLAASVADVKNERDQLMKARVAVAASEKTNLMAIAAAYDKMDPVGASQILTNMATGSSRPGSSGTPTNNLDDAVKILFYMQERAKAKVLAEMAAQEPALAAMLCQKLKQVQEGK